ncbi:hypothetical protein BH18THE2_BH18THE2_32670 [soil metagenome]
MNLLSFSNDTVQTEEVLDEWEVISSTTKAKLQIYSKRRGGTVHFQWNM